MGDDRSIRLDVQQQANFGQDAPPTRKAGLQGSNRVATYVENLEHYETLERCQSLVQRSRSLHTLAERHKAYGQANVVLVGVDDATRFVEDNAVVEGEVGVQDSVAMVPGMRWQQLWESGYNDRRCTSRSK